MIFYDYDYIPNIAKIKHSILSAPFHTQFAQNPYCKFVRSYQKNPIGLTVPDSQMYTNFVQ